MTEVTTGKSRLSLLLSILLLAIVGHAGYQEYILRERVTNQLIMNNNLQTQISNLNQYSIELNAKLDQVKLQNSNLESAVRSINPNQSQLIFNQLANLINGALQSLILYHDEKSALTQLNYAKQVLQTTNNALLADLKISLVKDIDNLKAQHEFDSIILATKLDVIYQQSSLLSMSTPVLVIHKSSDDNKWDKFVNNLKNTLLSLVKISQTKRIEGQLIKPEDELIARQSLQLYLLNVRQALITRNVNLWQTNLNDLEKIITQYFIKDDISFKLLLIIDELQKINFRDYSTNLDATINSLNKLELNLNKSQEL